MAVMLCAAAAVLALVAPVLAVDAPECKRFDQIYDDGKDLCETMWGEAFKYEEDESLGYTMWFFDAVNPNIAVGTALGLAEPDQCHLRYFHKDEPGPEPDTFTECHPWKDNACCQESTVESATALKEGYGAEYHWDRCGPMSQECERFFVMEACFYECEPMAGLYRKYPVDTYDENDPDHNQWQMSRMPIKASFCDAWFTACRQDLFCSTDSGDFFSCAAHYEAHDDAAALAAENQRLAEEQLLLEAEEQRLAEENQRLADENQALVDEKGEKDDDDLPIALIVVLVATVLVAFACGVGMCVLVSREKAGKPMFGRLVDGQGSGGQAIGAYSSS